MRAGTNIWITGVKFDLIANTFVLDLDVSGIFHTYFRDYDNTAWELWAARLSLIIFVIGMATALLAVSIPEPLNRKQATWFAGAALPIIGSAFVLQIIATYSGADEDTPVPTIGFVAILIACLLPLAAARLELNSKDRNTPSSDQQAPAAFGN